MRCHLAVVFYSNKSNFGSVGKQKNTKICVFDSVLYRYLSKVTGCLNFTALYVVCRAMTAVTEKSIATAMEKSSGKTGSCVVQGYGLVGCHTGCVLQAQCFGDCYSCFQLLSVMVYVSCSRTLLHISGDLPILRQPFCIRIISLYHPKCWSVNSQSISYNGLK